MQPDVRHRVTLIKETVKGFSHVSSALVFCYSVSLDSLIQEVANLLLSSNSIPTTSCATKIMDIFQMG